MSAKKKLKRLEKEVLSIVSDNKNRTLFKRNVLEKLEEKYPKKKYTLVKCGYVLKKMAEKKKINRRKVKGHFTYFTGDKTPDIEPNEMEHAIIDLLKDEGIEMSFSTILRHLEEKFPEKSFYLNSYEYGRANNILTKYRNMGCVGVSKHGRINLYRYVHPDSDDENDDDDDDDDDDDEVEIDIDIEDEDELEFDDDELEFNENEEVFVRDEEENVPLKKRKRKDLQMTYPTKKQKRPYQDIENILKGLDIKEKPKVIKEQFEKIKMIERSLERRKVDLPFKDSFEGIFATFDGLVKEREKRHKKKEVLFKIKRAIKQHDTTIKELRDDLTEKFGELRDDFGRSCGSCNFGHSPYKCTSEGCNQRFCHRCVMFGKECPDCKKSI